MQTQPDFISWKITCEAPAEAQALQQWLSSRINLSRVLTNTVRVQPYGVEQVHTEYHRLGDYFADIRLLPEPEVKPASFRLFFHRRPDAGRFWKDLMANILGELETFQPKAGIELYAKGKVESATTDAGIVIELPPPTTWRNAQ